MRNVSIENAFIEYELHESRGHPLCVCYAAPKMKRGDGEENKNFCFAFLSKEPPSRLLTSSPRLVNARICIDERFNDYPFFSKQPD